MKQRTTSYFVMHPRAQLADEHHGPQDAANIDYIVGEGEVNGGVGQEGFIGGECTVTGGERRR